MKRRETVCIIGSIAWKASTWHWLEIQSPSLLHERTLSSTPIRCLIRLPWILDCTGDIVSGAVEAKARKEVFNAGVQVFTCM